MPADVRQKYPDISRKEMARFRDKPVHFFCFELKYEIIWQRTIKDGTPRAAN